MPYRTRRELPDKVKKALPPHAQSIYRKAFNNALKQYDSEETAHKVAWAAVKRKYRKGEGKRWVRKTSNMGDFFLVPQADLADKSMLFPFSKGIYFPNGEFTRADGEELVANFKSNILERKNGHLPINPEHERAAGKIGNVIDVELGDDGVYGVYEWDKPEVAKRFDYTSAEIRWRWKHPVTGKEHRNVLLGVGATNYPKLLGATAIASYSEDESWEWAGAEVELEPYPIENALYELPRVNEAIGMLRWLTNVDGLQESAAGAMDALKPIAHALIDAYGEIEEDGKEDIPEQLLSKEGNMGEELNQEELVQSVSQSVFDRIKGLLTPKVEETVVEPEPQVSDEDFAEKMTELEDRLRTEFTEQLQAKDTEIQALSEAKEQAETEATKLTEQLAQEEAERRLAEFNERATELKVPVEGFGEILMFFHDADDSDDRARYNQLVAVMEAVKNQVDMSALFSESGTDGEGSSTEAQIEELVKQRMAKTDETYGEAYSAVISEHRELYKQYNDENVKSVASSAQPGEGVTYVA